MSGRRRPSRERAPRATGPDSAGAPRTPRPSSRFLPLLLLLAAATLPYLGAIGAGFLNWDDPDYVTANQLVIRPEGLARIWTTLESPAPYPLTFTTFWIEYRLWGDRPAGYHIVNILLHATATLLLWRFLTALRIRRSLATAVALLFAVHPTQVASVVWITERKNLLSAVFYFAALKASLQAHRRESWRCWGAVWLLAAGAMLSKSTTITLPVTLLLLLLFGAMPRPDRPGRGDRSRGRVGPLAGHLPLWILAGLIAVLTFLREQGPGPAIEVGLPDRLLIAGRSIAFYAGKLLFPSGLAGIYPRWDLSAVRLPGAIAGITALAVLALLVGLRRRLTWTPAFGWAQFLVALLPSSGLVAWGYLEKSFVADHFLYLPAWGFWLVTFGAIDEMAGPALRRAEPAGRHGHRVAPAIALLMALAVAPVTIRQVSFWKDTGSFWNHVLAENPKAWIGYANRGQWHASEGRSEDALADLRAAIRLNPQDAGSWFNAGFVLDRLGRTAEAIGAYETALRLAPIDPAAWNNLGVLYLRTGLLEEARNAFITAARLDPAYPDPVRNLQVLEARESREGPHADTPAP